MQERPRPWHRFSRLSWKLEEFERHMTSQEIALQRYNIRAVQLLGPLRSPFWRWHRMLHAVLQRVSPPPSPSPAFHDPWDAACRDACLHLSRSAEGPSLLLPWRGDQWLHLSR